eukprot:NODE_4609_length_1040_cov_110.918212_g4406_i0.p1 GENE.NODE_4609_length_1040_cov_110.918212_g4406_i0~~NODE_4609_length_1040_cov_110.918212_g4406_i0.p1  ORF type:complete len:278 (+),score=43.07 NODE_4609_length_1040_cov_110.918212_g4406_i0:72-905(+)
MGSDTKKKCAAKVKKGKSKGKQELPKSQAQLVADDHKKQVHQFLENAILGQYYDAFMADGYDDLNTVLNLTTEELEEIGLKKGHQKRFIKQVAEARKRTTVATSIILPSALVVDPPNAEVHHGQVPNRNRESHEPLRHELSSQVEEANVMGEGGDEAIVCRDCLKEFVDSVERQEWRKSMGYHTKPVRCLECRKAKKVRMNDGDEWGGGCFGCGKEGHVYRECPDNACFNCGKEGHMSRECPDERGSCFTCGKEGHITRDCPDKPASGGACFQYLTV